MNDTTRRPGAAFLTFSRFQYNIATMPPDEEHACWLTYQAEPDEGPMFAGQVVVARHLMLTADTSAVLIPDGAPDWLDLEVVRACAVTYRQRILEPRLWTLMYAPGGTTLPPHMEVAERWRWDFSIDAAGWHPIGLGQKL